MAKLTNKNRLSIVNKKLRGKTSWNKLDTKRFVEKAIIVHGNKYDYSEVKYTGWNEKVCIICKKHGEFWQVANTHSQGKGCKNVHEVQ